MLNFLNRLGIRPSKSLEEWIEQTSSYSGYEREAAIQALRSRRDGAAISCLLVRANDWVPAVRDAALLALQDFLSDEFASEWISALESLTALQRARRGNHAGLLSAVAALLGRPERLPVVLDAASRGSQAVRRYAFDLQCNQTVEDEQRIQLLVGAVLGDDLPIARRVLACATGAVSERVAHAACQSRFSELRIAGLRHLLRAAPESSRELSRERCLDRSGGVRAVALHAIRSHQEEPLVLELALARLNDRESSARSKSVALLVLGDLCPGRSRSYCEEAVQSDSSALRCAAYAQLLATASEDEKESLILRALADKSSRVQRVAVDSIRRGALPPAMDAVLSIALQHGTESAFCRATSMFRYYSYWTRLVALLRGLDAQTLPTSQAVWLQALVQWERDGTRSFVTPSSKQQQEIASLWNKCAPLAPHTLGEQISFHLSTFGLHTD